MSHQELQEKLQRGIEALNRADFPSAIELFESVVVEDSAHAEAWQRLAVCYLETARPDLAVGALERSLRHDPANADTHYLLGNACGASGELERAAACYRRALEIDPEHAKAEEFLVRTEALVESREHYRSGLRLLYSAAPTAADLNQALRELTQSVAIFPGSPGRDNLPECARKLLALRMEWPVAVEATAESHRWRRACERGYICSLANNWVGAREAYEEALEYRVVDAFVHHALGFCFAELGGLDDAVRAWLRTVELDPGYDFTHFGRVKLAG